MAQSTTGFEFYQGHHITSPVPVDTRSKVDTFAHLTDNSYWEKNGAFLFKGLIVTVNDDPNPDNNGVYRLAVKGSSPSACTWIKLGESGAINQHILDKNNPHHVTKEQIGLGNVDNTSDADKPVSTATQEAISGVQSSIDTHVANKNNPHQVTKSQVGLGNVDNTSDADKPVSTATQEALDNADATNKQTYIKNIAYNSATDKFTITKGNDSSSAITLPVATQSNDGLLSKTDKEKLDNDLTPAGIVGNLSDKILVTPSMTGTWTVYKSDGVSQIGEPSSNSNITVETGSNVKLVAKFKWVHDANKKDPTSCSGDLGTTLPASNVYSEETTIEDITSDVATTKTYSETIKANKVGLMVSGTSVVAASGVDSTAASMKVTFNYRVYYGLVTNSTPSAANIKALTNGLQSDRSKTISSITAGATKYYAYSYPKSLGPLTSIIQNGAAPVLGDFNRTEVTIYTNTGQNVVYYVYTSENPGAFNNVTLAFN